MQSALVLEDLKPVKSIPVPKKKSRYEKNALHVVQAQAARDKDVAELVRQVEGAVREIAGHFDRGLSREDVEDLRAAGRVGAVVAAGRYDADHESGASWNTYARHWIRRYVVHEVFHFWGRGRCKITRATEKIFFGYAKAIRSIEDRGGDLTPEAIAEVLHVPEDILADVVAVVAAPDRSYDAWSRDGEEEESLDASMADDLVTDALAVLCGHVDVNGLQEAIESLDDRSRYVIEERFYKGKVLREIGNALDFSHENVRLIEEKALAKLRQILSQ